MIKILQYSIAFLLVAGLIFQFGCEQKITPPVDTGRTSTIGDTNYVEVIPPWGGFESPSSIIIGNDQLIYVADYGRNEVVMLNAGGAILKRRTIPHPVSLAQNSKLDLYVGGETISTNGDTIGAIYKINLVRWDTTYISRIDSVIDTLRNDTTLIPVSRDTSYFYNNNLDIAHSRIVWQEPGRIGRRYTGIGILQANGWNNGYLVARTGADNSSFVDPDTRVLRFDESDALITPVGDLVTRPSGGTAITDIRNLTGLMVFPSTSNFVLTQSSEGVAFGAISMVFIRTNDREGWDPVYDPSIAGGRVDFVRSYQFKNAAAAAFDKSRQELFILDAGLDSVFKFDRKGKFKSESFGKSRTTSADWPGLKHPNGIAFSTDCTLFIADTGNKIIRRFKLSIQTQCTR
jgi:hypothetical protein